MDEFRGRGEDARFSALGKDDALGVLAQLLEDAFDEFHWSERERGWLSATALGVKSQAKYGLRHLKSRV